MITSASIIICTYNRSTSLIDTLESIARMAVSREIDWEVLVVDNNSSDNTKVIVENFISNGHGNIRYLFEENQGKAHALNHAINEAAGDVLAFTDDDALVDENWLSLIIETFDKFNSDCVGGRVFPVWLSDRPPWLNDRLLNVLAILDLGSEPRELKADGKETLYGVNYAFRREVFKRIGFYDTMLCARGAGNEDNEMIKRLWAAGGCVYYDPKISVHHKIFPERLTRAYFRRWHRLCGRDRAEIMSPGCRRVFGLEGYMLRNFGGTLSRLIAAAFRINADECFYQELYSWLYLSYFHSRFVQFLSGRVPSPR